MNLRIPLAVALIAVAGALTSCTVGNPNPPKIDTGVSSAPSGAPTETPTPTPTPTETVVPAAESVPPEAEMTLPADDGTVETAPFPAGAPIPAAELEGSRTAKQLRFIASRLDAYLAANGVPANWTSGAAGEDCWSYISVIYTQAEQDAWDNDISTPYTCKADGSYTLRGWSQSGADPKHTNYNTGLNYVSGKGFVRD